MEVLMVIKTTGLEYDDRLRKEVNSVGEIGNCEILALEYANQKQCRHVYEGAFARSIHLRSRKWFQRSKGLWIKIPEMYIRFLWWIIRKKPDIIWVHNIELMGLIPILIVLKRIKYIKRLIWDQHELPPDSLHNRRLFLFVYSSMMKQCDAVVMANHSRKSYLEKLLINYEKPSIYVLNNFPDQNFISYTRKNLPDDIQKWLNKKPYLLAQGGANPHRNLFELVNAVMAQNVYKLIVIGPYQELQINQISQQHGPEFINHVLFMGFVPQMEIIPFIDHASASVVFYDLESTNRRLCAPNRFYHALSRGTPVIVGRNPPTREIVDDMGIGIVVDSSNPECIQNGIEILDEAFTIIKRNIRKVSNQFIWESQVEEIFYILS